MLGIISVKSDYILESDLSIVIIFQFGIT